ncbi:MAG: hypothetical protein ACRD0W_01075 [Acidimicrobiales bacterium]
MGIQQVNQIIDALVVALDAAAALDGVKIAKGWEILPVGDLEYVFVASDGIDFDAEDVAVSTIEWPGPGNSSRTEIGQIVCAAKVWTGDQDAVDSTKDRAYALVGACEDVLRVDPALGITSIGVQVKITATSLQMVQESEGFAAAVQFTVSYQTSA